MRRLLLLALAGLLLGALLPASPASAAAKDWPWPLPWPDVDDAAATQPADAPAADLASGGTVRLGGVKVELRARTRQVVTYNHRSGHSGRISFWVKRKGTWHERLSATDGRIGYGGLVPRKERRQGTGTTPLGTFGMPFAFGMHRERDAWDIRYRKVRKGDYWVQDNASDHYNRYRNKSQGGFRWWLDGENSSERLLDYRDQYEWAIVMDFNWNQVRYRGSGIFLHVNGPGATAGCVSAPRWFIKRVMKHIDKDKGPVIAVGR